MINYDRLYFRNKLQWMIILKLGEKSERNNYYNFSQD